jgi:integrase
MQARYQFGNLTLRKRKKGPEVWQFRWVEQGKQRSVLIGTVEKLPTKADAERAVEHRRIEVNAQNPQREFHSVTVGALIDRFLKEYAPKRCRRPTQRVYRSLFEKHIRPKWGTEFLAGVKTLADEEWLENMLASRQVKSHIRNLMHTLYQAAIRWELVERNPTDLVRQSRKRLKTPRVLTPEEFKALLAQLSEPYRTMVIIIACLGLRVCELVGLQWGDIDFENLTLKVQRSFVEGDIYPTKTEASATELPLDPDLAEMLLAHEARSEYVGSPDFVFAGASGKPRWPDIMLSDYIKPAAAKAGIGKVGWHTFRHTFSSLLHQAGTSLAVQKELLRHADIQTTMNIYTQAASVDKREAVELVTKKLLNG